MPKTAQADENGIVSKLSNATLGCDPLVVKGKANGTKAPMYRVFGRATGIKEARDTNGEVIYGLTGLFEGTNLVTNVTMKSGVAYLPPGIQEMILGPLDKALADSGQGEAVEVVFGLDIYAVAAANKSGYSYSAIDLFPTEQTDPFAAMKAKLGDKDRPALTSEQKKLAGADA